MLNKTPDVRIHPTTRERIERAARELGYRPNYVARGRTSRTIQTLGLLTDGLGTAQHVGRLMRAVQEEAERHNLLVIALDSGGHGELCDRQTRALLDHRVEGIVFAAMHHRRMIPPPSARQAPAVLLNARDESGTYSWTVPDEQHGAELAVRELIRHGHKAIGFVTDGSDSPAANGRIRGYRLALVADGIAPVPRWVAHATPDAAGGYRAASTLLGLPTPMRPTAVLCLNDLMALGTYQACAQQGLRIPQDLSVIGFEDHEPIAASLRPELTTVTLPHQQMSSWAIGTLLTPTSAPRHAALPCDLTRRASVSAPVSAR